MGKDNATFLNLTLLVDSGGDITAMKRQGGWRSTSVTKRYIDDSEKNLTYTVNTIYSSITPQPLGTSSTYMQQ